MWSFLSSWNEYLVYAHVCPTWMGWVWRGKHGGSKAMSCWKDWQNVGIHASNKCGSMLVILYNSAVNIVGKKLFFFCPISDFRRSFTPQRAEPARSGQKQFSSDGCKHVINQNVLFSIHLNSYLDVSVLRFSVVSGQQWGDVLVSSPLNVCINPWNRREELMKTKPWHTRGIYGHSACM